MMKIGTRKAQEQQRSCSSVRELIGPVIYAIIEVEVRVVEAAKKRASPPFPITTSISTTGDRMEAWIHLESHAAAGQSKRRGFYYTRVRDRLWNAKVSALRRISCSTIRSPASKQFQISAWTSVSWMSHTIGTTTKVPPPVPSSTAAMVKVSPKSWRTS